MPLGISNIYCQGCHLRQDRAGGQGFSSATMIMTPSYMENRTIWTSFSCSFPHPLIADTWQLKSYLTALIVVRQKIEEGKIRCRGVLDNFPFRNKTWKYNRFFWVILQEKIRMELKHKFIVVRSYNLCIFKVDLPNSCEWFSHKNEPHAKPKVYKLKQTSKF